MWIVTKTLHTLYRIAVAQARRTIPDRIGHLFSHENGDFGAISVTKRSCGPAPISKVERHISDRFCVTLWCIVNRYSGYSGSEYWDLKIRGRDKLPRLPEANFLYNVACAHEAQTRVLAVLVSSRTPFSLLWRHLEDVSISRVFLTYNKSQSIPFFFWKYFWMRQKSHSSPLFVAGLLRSRPWMFQSAQWRKVNHRK